VDARHEAGHDELCVSVIPLRPNMPMIDPPHPGEFVREECLNPLGLTVTEGAKVLGVSRQALNNIVNEKTGISPEMAIRLEKAFGSSADMWLRLQLAFDLADARRSEGDIKVARYGS
jgi:addiction module HigA family antidote